MIRTVKIGKGVLAQGLTTEELCGDVMVDGVRLASTGSTFHYADELGTQQVS